MATHRERELRRAAGAIAEAHRELGADATRPSELRRAA
jgi:hypothetical protein